jgi:hypothetical protein
LFVVVILLSINLYLQMKRMSLRLCKQETNASV